MVRIRLLVLAAMAATALAGAAPALAPADATARRPLTIAITPIRAVFSESNRQTTYSFDFLASTSKPTITWTLEPAKVDPNVALDTGCDNHGVHTGSGRTFVWQHGNIGDPVRDDGCNHALQGKFGHQGLIRLRVVDFTGETCEATYKGTLSSDRRSVIDGTASLPVCFVPGEDPIQAAARCKCASMTVHIAPKSIDTEPQFVKFVAHWAMTCLSGTGGCNGIVEIQEGLNAKKLRPHVIVHCDGACGSTTRGHFAASVFAPFHDRFDETLFIHILLGCQGRLLTPVDLHLHFDDDGKVVLRKSKLR